MRARRRSNRPSPTSSACRKCNPSRKSYAPFDGVITARNTDIGALIDSGSSGGTARELFHIAAVNQLRVYVNVPQIYSPHVKAGLACGPGLDRISGPQI